MALFGHALEQRLRDSGSPALVAFGDGKPLPIGGNGKDPDARFGRGAGGIAKGYKLHAVWAGRVLPEAWEVTPSNANEKAVAERLIDQLLAVAASCWPMATPTPAPSTMRPSPAAISCWRRSAKGRSRAVASITRARTACGVLR